jgi:hypothetical protein
LRDVRQRAYVRLMSAAIIDAREVFGDLQRATRAQRFKTELAAFERQCSDRARTFLDMYEAVAWARKHPQSATYSILSMDDDLPDQVYVSRLARTLYDRRARK